jgi:endonuclease-3
MKNENTNKKKYINTNKSKFLEVIKILEQTYPDAKCSLDYNSPIELVMALILAAQCTDERVNKTIPILFEKFNDVYALKNATLEEIQKIIKSCGFYINKSKSILLTATKIADEFNGNVPENMKELCTLTGIGRKSSNIILQECFDLVEGIAVDTHVTRLSRRIGLSNSNTAEKIEQDLIKKLDKKYWNKINHIFVYHGRAICTAKKPKCDICPIKDLCPKNE